MILTYTLFLFGLVFLVLGANIFISSSVAIARRLNIPMIIIGLFVVASGTSTPELFVNIDASIIGASGIALGNILGSNVANIALVLAIASLISPVLFDKKEFFQNYIFLCIATFVLSLFLFVEKQLYLWHGIVFLILFVGYSIFSYINAKKSMVPILDAVKEEKWFEKQPMIFLLMVLILGLLGLLVGSFWVVDSATHMARNFGISEEMIGLTLVAVGTSLPELVTSIVAAVKNHHQIVLGNIIGSNIFNILFILGLSSIIHPIKVSSQILHFDLWVLILVTLILFPLVLRKNKLSHIEGIVFLIGYVFYVITQYWIAIGKVTF